VSDRPPHLATIRYSPGVDLEPHGTLLAEEGIACEPLGLEDAPSDLRHMPVLHLIATAWWTAHDGGARAALGETLRRPSSATIAVGAPGQLMPSSLDGETLAGWLDTPISVSALRGALRGALRAITLRFDLADKERQLARHARDMQELQQVGIALTSEHDMARLQTLILRTSRELTGADAGTLYLVEQDDQRHKMLAFHVAQNDSNALMDATRQDTVMPLTTRSVAGFVASTGQVLRLDDVYQLPAGVQVVIVQAVIRRCQNGIEREDEKTHQPGRGEQQPHDQPAQAPPPAGVALQGRGHGVCRAVSVHRPPTRQLSAISSHMDQRHVSGHELPADG